MTKPPLTRPRKRRNWPVILMLLGWVAVFLATRQLGPGTWVAVMLVAVPIVYVVVHLVAKIRCRHHDHRA